MSNSRLKQTTRHYNALLSQHDAAAQRSLTNAYQHTLAQIQPHLNKLMQQIREKRARGEQVPASWLYEQHRLETIKAMVNDAIAHYGHITQAQVADLQRYGVTTGTQAAQDQLQASVPRGISHVFGIPNQQALHNLVGATQPGSPLHGLFNTFGPQAADDVGNALFTGLSLGNSPYTVAKAVQDALDIPRARALTIARTEMLRSYRDAQLANFQANSDVVDTWIWEADMSGRTCAACIFMSGSEHPLDEDMDSHVNCFPAGTIVSGPRVLGSTTRWYSGEIVDIELASGNLLSVTPNHPILTSHGWVAAGLLNEGGDVLSYDGGHGGHPATVTDPDDYQVEAAIEEVAATFGESSATVVRTMPTAAEDFHGDGASSQVHIVRTYRHLGDSLNASLLQPFRKQQLCWRHAQLSQLSCSGTLYPFLPRLATTANSIMSGVRTFTAQISRHSSSTDNICFTTGSPFNASVSQTDSNHITGHAVAPGECQFRLTSKVATNNVFIGQGQSSGGARFSPTEDTALFECPEQSSIFECSYEAYLAGVKTLSSIFSTLTGNIRLDSVLKVSRRSFNGHVYNLQTKNNWYIANNIITHNCRCVMLPKTKSWADILGDDVDTSDLEDTSPDVQDGSDWFDNQDADTQQAILGNARYDLWKGNDDVTLRDFVGTHFHSEWGNSVYVRSVKDIKKGN